MAKILIFSDIHLGIAEARTSKMPFVVPKADVCVVAGDVSDDLEASLIWLSKTISSQMPVVFVLGNHEFFGRNLVSVKRDAKRLANGLGIHLLENDAVELDGVRFVGATLWTDFRLFENTESGLSVKDCMVAAKRALPDFVEIHANEVVDDVMSRTLLPKDTAAIHDETKRAFARILAKKVSAKTVVVTHHAPHLNSIGQQYKVSSLSAAYASDLSTMMADFEPEVWVHGHIHETRSYEIGRTRVVCNSRGYERHLNPAFLEDFIIEV